MTDQVRAVAEQLGDPFSVGLGVVGAAGRGASSMSRPIGNDELPSALGEALLPGEMTVAAPRASLGAAMDE